MIKYAIKVSNQDRVYPLGLYLGNVDPEEDVDYFKDYSPTLGQALTFESFARANIIASLLNDETKSARFEVVEVDSSDVAMRVRYQY